MHLRCGCQNISLLIVKKNLQIQQLNIKMELYSKLLNIPTPPLGWVRAIRTALGMSMQQLGKKLSLTKQSIGDIERREKEGSITLRALRETANAMDMQLVYGFVPKDGNLNELIERKAKELAVQIVLRTSNSMKLEDQENSEKRIKKSY